METKIIDGRKIKDEVLKTLREEVDSLPFPPVFCDILIGNDPASVQYVNMKARVAESIGIKFKKAEFREDITTDELIEEIRNLNNVPHMCGVIVQLPLPANSNLDKNSILNAIKPDLDVDCLGNHNETLFYNDTGSVSYPTALACMKVLDEADINLKDKSIVVLGQGKLVGLPVSHLLRARGYEITTVDSRTENIKGIIKDADVIISAVGQGKFITGDMVKEGVVIIDAGTSEENGAVVGDVDRRSVTSVASYLTPSPGGVGPVTVAMLLSNVVDKAKSLYKKDA